MNEIHKDFCFCSLALGQKYRLMIEELAQDIEKYAPQIPLILGTDKPEEFRNINNIVSFKMKQQGIFSCYNDKRFVLQRGLANFSKAVFIDADTRINSKVPYVIECFPGINSYHKNLLDVLEGTERYRPKHISEIKKVANKLNINIKEVDWIDSSLFIVTQDNGKEQEFFDVWDKVARYLELKGMHSGQEIIMGLAATKVGWKVEISDSWKTLNQSKQHLDASRQKSQKSFSQKLQRRLSYYYRLNKSRLLALRDVNFYYR